MCACCLSVCRSAGAQTDSAKARIAELLHTHPEAKGLRVGVTKGGCSGMEYAIDLTSETRDFDEIVRDGDATVYVDRTALLYVLGSELHFDVQDEIKKEFVFRNPNAKSTCGCGVSFSV